jgi:hypothetical protein
MLTRDRILELFTELDDELSRAGIRGDVFIVGGAAMTVAYDARPATRDVDGIWHPAAEVRSAAGRVAATMTSTRTGSMTRSRVSYPANHLPPPPWSTRAST